MSAAQPNLGELSQEQLMSGFEQAYTLAPYYMIKLGCRGEALDALQTDLAIDGWSVIEKDATDTSAPQHRFLLKPGTGNNTETSIVSCDDVEELSQFLDGCLNPECSLPEEEVKRLAVRHKVLMNIGYFFPVSLEGVSSPRQQKVDALNGFYKEAYLALPAADRDLSLSGSAPINEFVSRFAHGFALLGLLDSLQNYGGGAIDDEVARRGLARLIDNARVHTNPTLRPLGIPLAPETVQAAISRASTAYNRGKR